MAVLGKVVSKAGAQIGGEFVERLFGKGIKKIAPEVIEEVRRINPMDQKTILKTITEDPDPAAAAKGWGNMYINKLSEDPDVAEQAAEEIHGALSIFTTENKEAGKALEIERLLRGKNQSAQLTQMGQDIKTGATEAPEQLQDWSPEINQLVEQGKLERGPENRFEAIALHTNKFNDPKGINRMIRRFRSEKLPLGRTDITINRRRDRGLKGIRIDREGRLTLGEDQGFYVGTPEGFHAHHWTPLAVLDKVVEGLSPKQVKTFLTYMEKELGIFGGNHLGNLRQLPSEIHNMLHRRLDALGYNPQTLKSFAGSTLAERKAFMKKMKADFDELEKEVFREMMIRQHGSYNPKTPGSGVVTNPAMDKTLAALGISKEMLEGYQTSGMRGSMNISDRN